MMNYKKLLSLTLALALSAGLLTGCGGGDDASGSADASGSTSAQEEVKIEPMDLTGVTDPYLATAGIPGDTVMATVGEYEITAADLLHWLNYGIDLYESQMAAYGITDGIPWDMAVEDTTLAESMIQNALDSAAFYRSVPVVAEKEGLELSQEEKDFLAEDLANSEKELGGREMLDHVLWYQLSTVEQHSRFFTAGSLYTQLTDLYYGPDSGEYPTDAQVQAYAEDEMGAYRAKHILLATKDAATQAPLDEATCKEKKAQADDILAQIRAAEDPVAKFDELMKEHSEDPGLATAPDGYDAMKGQMVPEFEETALALKDGEISDVVESDFGYHIIMRLPLDLDRFRQIMINNLMDKRSHEWIEEMGVETTKEFDSLDPAEFHDKVLSLQAAVAQELEALQAEKAPETDSKG